MRRLNWRLPQMLARKGWDRRRLQLELAAVGMSLSDTQLWRLSRPQMPDRPSTHLLEALCEVFGCVPADLLILTDPPRGERTLRNLRPPPDLPLPGD